MNISSEESVPLRKIRKKSQDAGPSSSPKNHLVRTSHAALFLTLLFFLTGFLSLKPFFGGNDDGMLSLIAKGACKETLDPSEFLLFINVLTGLALKGLYRTLPAIHWYGWFLLTIFFIATWGLAHSLFRGPRGSSRILFLGSALFLAFIQYFSHVQYTLVTFWSAQAGLFLAFGTGTRTRDWKLLLPAGGLLLISSLIRFDGFGLALLAAVPFVLMTWRKESPQEKKKILFFGALLVVAISGPLLFHCHYYQSREAWSKVLSYWKVTSNLTEYRAVDQDPNAGSKLGKAGWSPSDYRLLSFHFWQGPEFSLESLKELEGSLGPIFTAKGMDWYKIFGDGFIKLQLLFLFLSFPFISPRAYRFALWNLVWVLLIVLYLYYFKKFDDWILWPLFTYLVFLCSLEPGKPEPPPILGKPHLHAWGLRAVILLLAVMSVHFLARTRSENMDKQRKEKVMESDIRALAPRNDRLYLISTTKGGFPLEAISVLGNYDLFNGFPIYRFGWEQNFPIEKELLGRFGIKDLFRDVPGRKDVFLISSEGFREAYRQYALDHYQIDLDFRPINHGTLFDTYQVIRKTDL